MASPPSSHQHCTDEAQKAETVLSAVSYIHTYIFISHTSIYMCADHFHTSTIQWSVYKSRQTKKNCEACLVERWTSQEI